MQGTIVVAERSKTVRRMVEIALDRQPLTLEYAQDADGAVAAVQAKSPAVVLVDAALGGDGYEVARRIKQDPAARGAKVLLLVGKSRNYDAARGRQAGVDGHVPKPFMTQQLVEAVFQAMGRPVPNADLFKTSTLNIPLARKPAAAPEPERKPAVAPPPPATGRIAPPPPVTPPRAPLPPPPAAAASSPSNPFSGVQAPFDAEGPTRQFGREVESEPPARPAPPPEPVAPAVEQVVQATTAAVAGNADLAQALSAASRETIERIAWEVIPQLAEAILKEEIARVVRERMSINA